MNDPKTNKRKTPESDEKSRHQSEVLDEELDESFPASDPPASTQPKPAEK
jgi:hypothetical protein